MQAHLEPHTNDRTSALALGGVLVAVGVVAFVLERTGVDLSRWLGGSGWTLFVIVPGVALLLGAIVATGGAAQGLTTAGAIVTTVGLLLLYQDQSGNYQSWAYAWALIPMSVGIALVVHGIRAGKRDVVAIGARMIALLAVVFAAGAWYFETIFRTGRAPFDLGEWWPIALVAIGLLVVLAALFAGNKSREATRD